MLCVTGVPPSFVSLAHTVLRGGVVGVVVVWVETREGCSCWQQKRAFVSTEVLPPLLILYLVEGQGSHDYLFFGKNSNIFPSHVYHDCCKEIMFTFKCTASMLHILCFTNAWICYLLPRWPTMTSLSEPLMALSCRHLTCSWLHQESVQISQDCGGLSFTCTGG